MALIPGAGAVIALNENDIPVTLVNGATGTGTGASRQFTVMPRGDSHDVSLSLQAILTGVFTSLTVDLRASSDGGTTFNPYPGGAGLNFQTASIQQVLHLVGGLVYVLNVTAFTGGTSVVINASVN